MYVGDEVSYKGSVGGWRVITTQVMGTDRGMSIQEIVPTGSDESGRIVKLMGLPALLDSLAPLP